jgi:hypothetical protein
MLCSVGILQDTHACARGDAIISAANALTVALDTRDLSHILSTPLLSVLQSFWTGAAGAAGAAGTHADVC